MKLGKYMTARAVGMAPHEAYTIVSTGNDILGVVEWYPRWKRYVFSDSHPRAVFSADCLTDLAAFLEKLTQEAGK